MAATISTDTTIRAAFLILGSTLDSLQNAADFSGDTSVGLHTAAWTEIQRDLRKRSPPVIESDLSDPSELQHAAHLLVITMLFGLSDIEADQIRYNTWRARYRKEMRQVNLSVPSEQPAAATETTLLRA